MRRYLLAALLLLLGCVAAAQTPFPTKFSPAIAARADVRAALDYVDRNFDAQVAEWIRLTEIPAPSGEEARRAAYVRAEFEKLGLPTTTDGIGNVVARRAGTGGGPTIVLAVHLDTVFPADTNVTVNRATPGILRAPGVFDDTAAVANLLQTARAMADARLRTRGDVIFLATVQEELGLKGMTYWFERNRNAADMIVAIDNDLGPVLYGALGIYWSKMIFTAAGAHTNNSRGQPNPARAAAQCITDIYAVPLPDVKAPVGAIYNVGGLMTGGDVVNAIPQEVTFSVDLRTVDPVLLAQLDKEVLAKCEQAGRDHGVEFEREFLLRLEAGGRPEQLEDRRRHPVVQTAIDVLAHLGWTMPAGGGALATGSTDANVGVVSGVPSIAIGRSRGGGQHTLQEWADIETARLGTKQIILLAAALAEVAQ